MIRLVTDRERNPSPLGDAARRIEIASRQLDAILASYYSETLERIPQHVQMITMQLEAIADIVSDSQ